MASSRPFLFSVFASVPLPFFVCLPHPCTTFIRSLFFPFLFLLNWKSVYRHSNLIADTTHPHPYPCWTRTYGYQDCYTADWDRPIGRRTRANFSRRRVFFFLLFFSCVFLFASFHFPIFCVFCFFIKIKCTFFLY